MVLKAEKVKIRWLYQVRTLLLHHNVEGRAGEAEVGLREKGTRSQMLLQ
jgi:hypothetical protein